MGSLHYRVTCGLQGEFSCPYYPWALKNIQRHRTGLSCLKSWYFTEKHKSKRYLLKSSRPNISLAIYFPNKCFGADMCVSFIEILWLWECPYHKALAIHTHTHIPPKTCPALMQTVSGVPWALKETDGLCVWNVFDGERGNNTLPYDDITIKFLSTVTIFVRSLK